MMTKRKIWATLLLLGLCVQSPVWVLSYAADDVVKTQSPEKLLPANADRLYSIRWFPEAQKRMGANRSIRSHLYKSGLMDVFKKALEGVITEARKQGPS